MTDFGLIFLGKESDSIIQKVNTENTKMHIWGKD